jgi:apolipoprotein N-acyltransferase
MFLVKREHSNKNFIIKGLISAIFLSAFIYLKYFGIEYKIINTLLALVGFYLLLTIPRKALFYTGFFVGIFWFYWIGISVQYYDLLYLAPIVILAFAIGYGIIFYLFAIYDKTSFRLLAIFTFSFLSPFGFNWLKFELIFLDSYFKFNKEDFALILICIYAFIHLKKISKLIVLFPLYFALSSSTGEVIDNPNIKISMAQLNMKQDLKWNNNYRPKLIEENLDFIKQAINEKKELIILPETSIPTYLNKSENLLDVLKNYSYKIDIITGSLYVENNNIYNATYHFSNGSIKIAKKVVLVPFGEEIPLPQFLVNLINDIFYNGAKDYAKAQKATDFIIKGEKFRNAICFEATTDKIYEDLNEVKYMIATSNNAWFTPSIEPTLQDLLLKYYSKKYNITIFHVVNGSGNKIFRP